MILDTNALSALVDGNLRIKVVIERASKIAIPSIVVGEYSFGIAQSRHRKLYESWLSNFLEIVEVLNVTRSTAGHYASIRAELKRRGTPIAANDLWIAAICLEHGFPLLSRDRDFDLVNGIERVDW